MQILQTLRNSQDFQFHFWKSCSIDWCINEEVIFRMISASKHMLL